MTYAIQYNREKLIRDSDIYNNIDFSSPQAVATSAMIAAFCVELDETANQSNKLTIESASVNQLTE